MFSSNLLLPGLTASMLLFACQVLFAAANRGGWDSSGPTKHMRCETSFSFNTEMGASCGDISGTYRCDHTSCNVPNLDRKQNLTLSALLFDNCHSKGRRWTKVRAISFKIPPNMKEIDVLKGDAVSPLVRLPLSGVACDWSELRPECDRCDSYRNH
ncbi:hypothetical protein O181_096684 [Austropuccinia psidii MF-1]|uniref:Cyanovirin-N domain-containing protein n=1 Tax=Austropuccinia psidii MF-1 TaxID=1389203 RepID=A0A9Q3PCW7_9BASI|nr:hypothetical protein [Austropuccinia psidii MF-1]